jgi:protein translocase SecG subunit
VKVGFAVVQDVLAVLVMLGVLLQTPKATGLGGTIGGGGDSGGGYRRRRGLEASLLRITIGLILGFVAVSIVQTYLGAHY